MNDNRKKVSAPTPTTPTLESLAKLTESKIDYKSVFENMEEGFAIHEIICDENGKPCDYRFLDMNPAFEKLTMLSRKDLIGRRVLEVLPETENHWIETYGKVALSGKKIIFENYSKEIGRHYEVVAYQPAPGQFAAIFTDITDQKLYINSLKEFFDEFNPVMDSLDAQVYMVDIENNEITYINQTVRNIYGDCIGKKCWKVFHNEESICPFCPDSETNTENLKPSEVFQHEYFNNSNSCWYELRTKLIRLTNGRLVRLAIIMDITARKQNAIMLQDFGAFQSVLADIRVGPDHEAEDILLNRFLQSLIKRFKFRAVWYGTYENERVTPQIFSGFSGEAVRALELQATTSSTKPRCAIVQAITSNQPFGYADLKDDECFQKWESLAGKMDCRSNLAIPLLVNHEVRGAFMVYSSEKEAFPPKRVHQLLMLIEDVSKIIQTRQEWIKIQHESNETRRLLDLALEGADLGIWNWDMKTNHANFNVEWWGKLGYSPNDVDFSFQFWKDLLHPDDEERMMRVVQDALDGKTPYMIGQYRLKMKNGGWKWIISRGRIIEKDPYGTAIRSAGTHLDITEMKETEQNLIELKHRLNIILDNMHEAIVYHAPDRRIMWLNRTARELIGKDENEIIGSFCHEVWDGIDHRCENCPIAENQRIDLKWERHVTNIKTKRIYRVNGFPIMDDSGTAIAFMEVSLDVTEQEEAKQEAKLKTEQLYHADKLASLGTLVAGVCHEINNPNNFIMLNISTMQEFWETLASALENYSSEHPNFKVGALPFEEMKDDLKMLLDGILDGSKRIKSIVNDLRDFARQESDDLSETVEINEVIKSSVKFLDKVLRISTSDFKIELTRELPTIFGNSHLIEQVLINLIQNSCQALENVKQMIKITSEYDARSERVRIVLEDQGRGIAPEELKRVKDPFHTTRRTMGAPGLGLSISESIIQKHNGSMTLESKLGEGTKVTILLPISMADK